MDLVADFVTVNRERTAGDLEQRLVEALGHALCSSYISTCTRGADNLALTSSRRLAHAWTSMEKENETLSCI